MPENQDEQDESEKESGVSGWCTLWVSNGEIILQKNRLVHTNAEGSGYKDE